MRRGYQAERDESAEKSIVGYRKPVAEPIDRGLYVSTTLDHPGLSSLKANTIALSMISYPDEKALMTHLRS